jgi:hypothetical protein
VQPDFTSLLVLYLQRRRWKYAEFSRLVGRSTNYVSGLINQHHGPPLEDLKLWISKLQLTPEESAEFEEAALLAHAPPQLVQLYLGMKKRLSARPDS